MESMQLKCAKNDDLSLLDSLDPYEPDQAGKRVIDYMLECESVNVFKALIEDNPETLIRTLFNPHIPVSANLNATVKRHYNATPFRPNDRVYSLKQTDIVEKFVYLCLISNEVQVLERYPIASTVTYGIKSMLPARDKIVLVDDSVGGEDIRSVDACVLSERCFEAFADPSKVSDESFDYILIPYGRSGQYYWTHGFTYIADKCYEAGQTERLEKILRTIENVNEAALGVFGDSKSRNRDVAKRYYDVFVKGTVWRTGVFGAGFICSFSRILKKTFDKASERGDGEAFERFRKINTTVHECFKDVYMPSKKKEGAGTGGKSTAYIQNAVAGCIHDNILNTKQLEEIEDETLVKEALDKLPIDIREWIYNETEAENWPALFRLAVDQGDRALIESAMECDGEFFKIVYRVFASQISRNPNRLPAVEDSFEEDVAEIKERKKEIYEEYLFKKHGKIVNYPKELFEKYYASEDYERVAISLCTRMEILFKDKYKLEGDLCAMIDEFAEKQKISAQRKGLLHTVRMYRNSIVHPTGEDAEKIKNMNVKKTMRDGIDFICSLS